MFLKNELERFGGILTIFKIFGFAAAFLSLTMVGMVGEVGHLGFAISNTETSLTVLFELCLAYSVGFMCSWVPYGLFAALADASGRYRAVANKMVLVLSWLIRLTVTAVFFAPSMLIKWTNAPQTENLLWIAMIVCVAFVILIDWLVWSERRKTNPVTIAIILSSLITFPIGLGQERVKSAKFGSPLTIVGQEEYLALPVIQNSYGILLFYPEKADYLFITSNEIKRIEPHYFFDNGVEDGSVIERVVRALAGSHAY